MIRGLQHTAFDDVDSDGSEEDPEPQGAHHESTSASAEIAVLVQTCDKYRQFWPLWHLFFFASFKGVPWRVFLLTEEAQPELVGVEVLAVGTGEFSDRLRRGLERLREFPYVLYLQDDFWPLQPAPPALLPALLRAVQRHRMHFLRIMTAPEMLSVSSGRILAAPDPLQAAPGYQMVRFEGNSPFALSHQATIWPRTLLLSLMVDGENAFQNEVLGTQRLQQMHSGRGSPPLFAFGVQFDWYRTVVGHPGPAGKINPYGRIYCEAARETSGRAPDISLQKRHLDLIYKQDAMYAQVEALTKQMATAVGQSSAKCPFCGLIFNSHAELYASTHSCPTVFRDEWFAHHRKPASKAGAHKRP